MFPQPSYASLSLPSTTTPCPPYASSRNTAKLARHHQLRSTSGSIRPPLPTRDYPAPPMDSSDQQLIGIAVVEEGRRCCVECRTTTTPMWRSGPTGPRSLCNACGIRYRKKRRRELGLDNKQQLLQQQQQEEDHSEASSPIKDSNSSSSNKSSRLQVVKKRRVLMGVEEAAFLLMALSSSSTSALLHGQEPTPLVHNVHT